MKRFFVIFVMAICCIPGAGMIFLGASLPGATETPVPKPTVISAGRVNPKVLSDISSYFDKRFTFRQELITVNSQLIGGVFDVSPVSDVIIGKDGWLFYEETTDDYFHKSVLSDAQIDSIVNTLKNVQRYWDERGINFLFVIAPNKNSVYPQYMPYDAAEYSSEKNVQKLFGRLAETDVSYINLFDILGDRSEQLYFKLDSHWNNLGAAVACDEILRKLGRGEASYANREYTITNNFEGDLYRMLFPTGAKRDNDVTFLQEYTFTYDVPLRAADDILIKTSCAEGAGNVLVFRDSFGNALYPFLAQSFERAVFSRKIPYNPELAFEHGADTVIIVMAERNIAQFEKHMPQDKF